MIASLSITYRAGIGSRYSDSLWNLSRVLPNDLFQGPTLSVRRSSDASFRWLRAARYTAALQIRTLSEIHPIELEEASSSCSFPL